MRIIDTAVFGSSGGCSAFCGGQHNGEAEGAWTSGSNCKRLYRFYYKNTGVYVYIFK